VTDGNEADKAVFARVIQEFQQQLNLDALFVADSALYSENNLKSLASLKWISRVPLTIAQAQKLVHEIRSEEFVSCELEGYRIAQRQSNYAGIEQRWVIVESQARRQADIKQLYNHLHKLDSLLCKQLHSLCHQKFRCESDALAAAERFEKKLKYHCLEGIVVVKQTQHSQRGRPRKGAQPQVSYQLTATLVRNQAAICTAIACSGRFILATNVTDVTKLSTQQVLQEYKEQQSPERGFRFLKDPLFFTSSVFVKSPERVAALAFIMGLCLLVYNLGQRQLRLALVEAGESINNQLGKPTQRPTLRWVFQCFQDVHLLLVAGVKRIANLTEERRWILRFLGAACGQYYLVC
jgi:transposase